MQKGDFEIYYANAVFDLPEKVVVTNTWIFLEYLSPSDISCPIYF